MDRLATHQPKTMDQVENGAVSKLGTERFRMVTISITSMTAGVTKRQQIRQKIPGEEPTIERILPYKRPFLL